MTRNLCAIAVAAILVCVVAAGWAEEPVIGGPCEGCELVFAGLPDNLTEEARIAPEDEPGEALIIEGTVTGPDGQPVAGIIVYAYHTDATGMYPDGPTRHGRLRGWARTDAAGRYRFDTVRPAAYPGRSIPQHVHMHVIEPGIGTYWIDSIHFTDDPLLSERERTRAQDRGGSGVAVPTQDAGGRWRVTRDIRLGENVPGYPAR